jgi:dipeptidyl aminopeptidase/acylaminoacyl peptidase
MPDRIRTPRENAMSLRCAAPAAIVFLFAVLMPGAPEAAETDLLTPEIAVDLRFASGARISPDGSRVLYRLRVPRDPDDEPGGPRYELRLVPADGGPSRLFVPAGSDPSAPAWSPDGRWIGFLSERRAHDTGKEGDPRSRLFILRADGGEARPLTPPELSVELFCWSPDGARVAFVAADAETEERKKEKEGGADWKVDHGELRDRVLRVVDVESGEVRALTEGISIWEMDWSPDGASLVAAVTDEPLTDQNYMFQRLVVVPVAGGEPRLLVPENGKLESPRFSPDGRHVAWLGGHDRHDPSPGTLFVVPSEGGEPTSLLAEGVADYRWIAWRAPDQIVAAGEEGLGSVLDIVFLDEHLVSRPGLYEGRIISGLSISADGSRVAFSAHSPQHPAEVFTGTPGARPTRLTWSNPVLDGVTLAEQEPFEWTARDDTGIQGVLIKPVGFQEGRRYPLLVNPHGGPEYASLNGWVASSSSLGQMAAARGYLVLQPNYRGSTGRGEAFARGDHRDLGGKEFDDVLDGIDALVERGWADPERVAIMGGSYGGFFSAWGATRHSERFAAAVKLYGISNWISFSGTTDIPEEMTLVHWGLPSYMDYIPLLWERSPLAWLKKAATPTMILHGEEDRRVPVSQSVELFTALRLEGIPVELVVYPREGHGFSERAHWLDAVDRSLSWLDRHLGVASQEP